MKYIEFTGPAGSGKSTLVESLTDEHKQFLSKKELICKYISPNQATRYVMARRGMGNIAKLYWSKHKKYKYFFNFAKYNPEFLRNSISYVQRQRGKFNSREVSMMNVMSIYQLSQESLNDNEILVLDEGFYHKTAVHAKHGELPSDQYVASMPSPDVLIHVDPPIELARQRCKKRDGKVASREVYEQARRTKKDLISMSEDIGVKVIEVENKGGVESTADLLRAEVSEIIND